MTSVHRIRVVSIVLAAASLGVVPAFAQMNLSGVWGMTLYEDFPDRLAGPELGDYGGIPINAAARLRLSSEEVQQLTDLTPEI